jgi:hypothetical protein
MPSGPAVPTSHHEPSAAVRTVVFSPGPRRPNPVIGGCPAWARNQGTRAAHGSGSINVEPVATGPDRAAAGAIGGSVSVRRQVNTVDRPPASTTAAAPKALPTVAPDAANRMTSWRTFVIRVSGTWNPHRAATASCTGLAAASAMRAGWLIHSTGIALRTPPSPSLASVPAQCVSVGVSPAGNTKADGDRYQIDVSSPSSRTRSRTVSVPPIRLR